MQSKINKTRTYFTFLFTAYFALTLYRFIRPENILITSVIIFIGFISLIHSLYLIRKSHLWIYFYIYLLIIGYVISSIIVLRSERIWHVVLFILSNTGVAMILIKNYVYCWGTSFVFYLLAIFFITLILMGIHPDESLSAVSHNGISMLIIVACVTHYIVSFLNGKKLFLLPAILTFLISVWGSGRSGIISSFIILLGLTFIRFRINLKISFILGVTTLILIYYSLGSIVGSLGDISLFSNAASIYLARDAEAGPDIRFHLWQYYFNNLDFYKIVFGLNVFSEPWPRGQEFAYNYHNSYINLHLQTGLMGLFTISLFILSIIKFFFKNQIFFVLFLALSLRWLVDVGLYFETWDYLPFFFTFLSLIGKDFKPFIYSESKY